MELTFLGATGTVTGSKYLLEHNGKRLLVDCGLFQGYKELRLRNWDKLPINPHSVDAVVLTHAHIDHAGYVPLLVKSGFKGRVFCTKATHALCDILLPDSGFLQEEDARRANLYGYSKHHPAKPLYTEQEARKSLECFTSCSFDKKYVVAGEFTVTFYQAGHILGAAWILVECAGKKIIFSGDVGRVVDPVMPAPKPLLHCDYLVVESTYGNRLHKQEAPLLHLEQIINKTASRGGSVVIPAFAVGRTQSILYYLYQLRLSGAIGDIPIYLDSPMAINATNLYKYYSKGHRLSEELCEKVCDVATYVRDVEDSKTLDQQPCPKIIISASGMATGGRILHHLKHYLTDSKHTIVFTGYQAGGTRGDRLLKGEKTIKVHGEQIPVRASIEVISNMSAHADYEELLTWFETLPVAPVKVYVIHGEKQASQSLCEKIEERYQWRVELPSYQQKEVL